VVDIATPHIAGYSFDAKVAGSAMMEEALRAWLAGEGRELPAAFDWTAAAPPAALVVDAPPVGEPAWLLHVVRAAYDIKRDDARFRSAMLDPSLDMAERADAFTDLRRRYPTRRSWRYHAVRGPIPSALESAVSDGLLMSRFA
jgi:erythronate-4-phosphate dehydrogenase